MIVRLIHFSVSANWIVLLSVCCLKAEFFRHLDSFVQVKVAMAFVMASDDQSWSDWQMDSSCEEDQACWASDAVTFWNPTCICTIRQ